MRAVRNESDYKVDLLFRVEIDKLLPLKTNYLTFLNHLVNSFLAQFRKVLTSEKFLPHLKVKIHRVLIVSPKS